MTEKQLKYYPCSVTYAGNPLTKSSYLVSPRPPSIGC
jgi:hypothetical protein